MNEHKWNRVTIVGCGLIGESFALALRRSGMCQRIAGWDVSQSVLKRALERGVIDEVDLCFTNGAISPSDLIYLAMPVTAIIKLTSLRDELQAYATGQPDDLKAAHL
ncbi:MAG: prephenate dehydrogenase/arogenate dehydrogenase family protein [Pyrinomonadaceae bacterium]